MSSPYPLALGGTGQRRDRPNKGCRCRPRRLPVGPHGRGPPRRRCRHAPGGSERRNRRPSFRRHRKSACRCVHARCVHAFDSKRARSMLSDRLLGEPAQARDGGGIWRFRTGQGDRGGGGRGGCSGSLAPGTVSQAGLRRGRSGRGWLTP